MFDNFPYTNFHELNLDWIIKSMEKLNKEYKEYGEELIKKLNKPVYDGHRGQVLTNNGDGTTSWTDFNSKTYNVIYYGADPTGTEYSDDAIASAIEANKGGQIYFPSGTFLISRPIKTYDAVKEAVSIYMESDTIIKTDIENMECIFDIGALQSIYPDRYPAKTYNRIIYGGVIDATNCQYAIIIEDRAIQYTIDNITCINCTNGIRISRNNNLSQDTVITNSYIVGKGSEYEGTGILIYGNDNIMNNVKIYFFQKAVYNLGASTRLLHSHALAIYRTGTSGEEFNNIYQNTCTVDCRGYIYIDDFYSDGYYRMVDIHAPIFIQNSEFYNYTGLENRDVSVFKINTQTGPIRIMNNLITILQPENTSKVIDLSDNFITTSSRLYNLIVTGFIVSNNIIKGKQYLYNGDIGFNDNKNIVTPKVYMSNNSQIVIDTWYVAGYIVTPDTIQSNLELHIGGDHINIEYFVSGSSATILRAEKLDSTVSGYEVKLEHITDNNNYHVYAVCFRQTYGTAKVKNCHIVYQGIGFVLNYNTDNIQDNLRTIPISNGTQVQNRRFTQHGKTTMAVEAGQVGSKAITFPTAYPSGIVPFVSVVPLTGQAQSNACTVNQVTNTGFNIYLSSVNGADIELEWFATD